MDRAPWNFFMGFCFGYFVYATNCSENPALLKLGTSKMTDDTTNFTMQDTSGDMLFIPDRDVIFPADGKLLDFSFWFNATYPSCSVKVVALKPTTSLSSTTYTVNAVSEIYNRGRHGWNKIDFDLDKGYLPVKAGDTLGMIFYYYNYLLYSITSVEPGNCLDNGTMETFSANFYSLAVNSTFTSTVSSNYCRSYKYQAHYIPYGVCLNITLTQNETFTLEWTLLGDRTDSVCWNIKAPLSASGEWLLVEAIFTTAIISNGAMVELVDGNGKTLTLIQDSANTMIGKHIRSVTNTLNINFSSSLNNESSHIVVKLSTRPSDQCAIRYAGICRDAFFGLVIGTILAVIILIIIIIIIACVRRRRNRENVTQTLTFHKSEG